MVRVKRARSGKLNAAAAAAELADLTRMDDAVLALVFATPEIPPVEMAAAAQRAFGDVPVYGATTAGEIGPGGFREGTSVAMTLASDAIRVGGALRKLEGGSLRAGREAAEEALAKSGGGRRRIGLALVDPYSRSEESFVAGAAATALRLVGGAASAPVSGPPNAHIFCEGRAAQGCGLVVGLALDLPASIVVTDHMKARDERLVVTRSEPEGRIVHELNGRPALDVFCETYELEPPLGDDTIGMHPFIQMVGGRPYVRSVMTARDSSLLFACAVSNGVVLRPTDRGNMLKTTEEALQRATEDVGGEMAALVAFQCLGRYLESGITGERPALSELFSRYPVVGLQTLAEIAGAVHVNHTLTALAIGNG